MASQEVPDVVQDTLEIIWRKLPQFEGRSSLETWMYRVCTFQLMNAVRAKSRVIRKQVNSEALEVLPAGREELPVALRFERLYTSLERLSPVEERVVRLKHYEDRTFDQIGGQLGLTPSGAKHHYYRAIDKLRELLTQTDREDHG